MATSLFYNIHWSVTCFLYLSSSLTMSIFSLGMFGITGIYSFTGNGSSLRVLYASLGLVMDQQRVESDLRLLDNSIKYFLAQFITNSSLLALENIIADGLTQIFQVIVLTIGEGTCKGVVEFRNLFNLYFMEGHGVVSF